MPEIYGFAIKVEDNAVKSIDAIDSSLIKLEGHASKAQSGFNDVFKGFLGANLVMESFSLIRQGLGEIISTGVQMEQTGVAFEVMLGSAKKGREMTSELKKWADITPFDNQTAFDAGRLLLNYGISAEKIVPYMNMLGDASGGVKDRFDRMSYAFAQVSAAGRLQGQDLRQLIDAGFNPLQEMSKMTGKSMLQLKKEMEAGQITFDRVVQAFQHAAGEGGRFNGMMIKQSQTVGGLFSTLQSYGQNIAAGLFQRMTPTLKDLTNESIKVAKSIGEWVSPRQSDILRDQKTEMNNLFSAVKDGNIPTEIRKNLIDELNVKFKDYLPNLISEKDTLDQIANKQKAANDEMNKSITLQANKERLEKIRKQESEKMDKATEKLLAYQDIVADPKKKPYGFVQYYSEERANEIFGTIAKNDKKIADLIKSATNWKSKDKDWATSALMQYEDYLKFQKDYLEMANYEQYYLKRHKGIDASAFESGVDATNKAFGDDGMSMGASGGLSTAKQINIRVDKLLNVETKSIEGMTEVDLRKVAEDAVDLLTREVHNQMVGAGEM